MLSAQADELRELAGDGSVEFVSGPIRASVLRDAADTILELRDDLQRANDAVRDAEHDESMAWDRVRKANAENARLRSELESVGTASYLYGRSDLKAENAKLRELCKEMMAFVEDDDACERCGHDAECVEAADGELVLPYEGLCLMLDLFADRMRELGVEVEHE
jgi:hypothetical protein